MPQQIIFTEAKPIQFTEAQPLPEVDDRGWRVVPEKGMPPVGRVRSPEEQQISAMLTGGVQTGAALPIEEPPLNVVADYYDIGTKGSPLSVLAKADLTNEKTEDYARLLSQEFDQQVSVYRHPELNELVYKDPETKRVELIIDPNSPFQGLAANPAAVAQLGAEIAGGIAGYVGGSAISLGAGGPTGAAIGSASAAFLSRMTRLEAGKLAGYHDYTQGEMLLSGATDAMFALAGAGIGEAAGAIFRRMVGSPQVKRYLQSLTDEELDVFNAALENTTKDVQEEYGIDLSVGQVLQEAKAPPYMVKEVRTLEERLRAESVELRTQKAAQQERVAELGEEVEVRALPETPETALRAPEITEEIADVARKEVDDRIAGIETKRDTALAEYEADLTDIMDSPELIGTPDRPGAYDQVVEALGNARSKIFGREGTLGRQYSDFWERVGEPPVNLGDVRAVAQKHGATLESDILPALAAEDKDIVRNILEVEVDVPMASVNRALSVIKSEIRKTPDVRRGEKAFLIEMKDALSKVRDNALGTVDKNAARELKAIDTNYAKTATDIDTAQINRILKTNKEGSFATPTLTGMKAIIGDKGRSAEAFMRLAEDSTSPIYGSLETVRTGIRSLYRDTMNDKTGAGRIAAHKAFMRANGDGMKRILTPTEYKAFNKSAPAAMDAMKIAENKAKRDIRNIEKSFEGRLTNADNFDNIVDMVKTSKSPIQDTNRIKNLLKNSPDLLDQYKGLRARRMMNEMQSADDLGNKVFDPAKMDNLLKTEKEIGELQTLFGPQYVADLRKIQKLTQLEGIPGAVGLAAEWKRLVDETGPTSAALMAWRGLVARPLSRAGLLTTSALKLQSRGARQAMAKLLANPKEFKEVMSLYRRNAPLEKWRTVLTNVGLANLLEEEYD